MYVADIFVSENNYSLVGVGFTFTVLAIVVVVLRIFTRLWVVKSFGVDDSFIVLSALATLGFLIAVIDNCKRHFVHNLPSRRKLSISIQCLRIFDIPVARRLFISIIAFLCVYGTLCLLLTIMTCLPVEKYWNDSIPGRCLDNRAMRYAFAGINIANDFVLLIAPMPFLKSLQMARKRKYALMAVFAAGGVACVIAIIRLYSLWAYSSVSVRERPVNGIEIAIWSGLECNIAIICACVPSLNPLLSRTFLGSGSSWSGTPRQISCGNSAHSSPHNWTDISHRCPGHESKGIKAQPSFELGAISVCDDNDSAKNLVTSSVAPRTSA
ncbi:hypothetical protein VFPPC_12202 [Pochonia chlamydosporia 170]|uniref:Rhodopsin domain-containing protein n=1 Tax=Pochonia chlamydosporia 170 TaxID=1380566 RepID=A0A179EWN5_METCM|nr:hypothetical protein VFPPC_12202 [Pochonia chlamydosporia 170]OAQ57581.1 hypothetical protein VFPPC_12202 [Pochonia chlamydosporia 170]